jgi:hypothetical protein
VSRGLGAAYESDETSSDEQVDKFEENEPAVTWIVPLFDASFRPMIQEALTAHFSRIP